MAQVEMTVSIDAQRQEQIERYCALSGVSPKVAFDEIWDLWLKQVYIPLCNNIAKKERQRKAIEDFEEMRARAERGETPDLTMEEIIEEIALARKEQRTKKME